MSLAGIFPIDKWNFNSQYILSDLLSEEYSDELMNSNVEKYAKGQVIFREGSSPSGIFFIKSGRVKKYKVDESGRENIIYVANSGELIGYHAVLAGESYPDSAAAIEESTLAFIRKEDFLAVLDKSPALSRKLLKTLSHEFAVLANSISVQIHRSARERMAITLIILRERYKKGVADGQPIIINLSRYDIAGMAGITRENTVRILRDFKDENIIETKGRQICITDVKKLVAISNYK